LHRLRLAGFPASVAGSKTLRRLLTGSLDYGIIPSCVVSSP